MGSITVTWNQYAKEVNSSYWKVRNDSYSTATFNDGVVNIQYLQTGNVAYLGAVYNNQTSDQVDQTEGDIWYASYCVNANESATWSGEFCSGGRSTVKKIFPANTWGRWSALGVATTRKKPFYFPYCETVSSGMTA